jgi:hypothetical protein
VIGRVETVPGEGGEVDPADEGGVSVDDRKLLVVAVQRPLARVQRELHLRPADEGFAHRAHLPSVGVEERQWRSGPAEHPHLDALRRLREQLPQCRLRAPADPQLRREEPAREPDVRPCLFDCLREPRQRFRTVDEHLQLVPRARRRFAGGPAARGRIEGPEPADALQPPTVVRRDDPVEQVAEGGVGAFQDPCHG